MTKKRRYTDWVDGEWCEVLMRGQVIACCDCAKVHIYDFRMNGNGKLEVRVREDQRATAVMRRPFKFAKDDE